MRNTAPIGAPSMKIIPANITTIAYAVGALLIFALGWKVADWQGDAQLASAKRDWAELEAGRLQSALDKQRRDLAAVRTVEVKYVEGAERVRTETKIVTREVVRYVQNPAVERVYLPAEWVRLHDHAATGVQPAASGTGSTDDQTQTVSDADAIATVAGNYNDCRGYIEQVTGLQAYALSLQTGATP